MKLEIIFVSLLFIGTSMAAYFPDTLWTTYKLWPDWGILRSNNGKYEAVMQHDGNFVIYKKYNSKDYANPIWNTGTQFSPAKRPFYLFMQSDGNLVMYSIDRKVVWASHTCGHGQYPYRLVMQNDGNLVLYDNNGKATWNSHTAQCMPGPGC